MKKLGLILIIAICVFCTTGCRAGIEQNYTLRDDGTYDMNVVVGFDKESYDDDPDMRLPGSYLKTMADGKEYYVIDLTKEEFDSLNTDQTKSLQYQKGLFLLEINFGFSTYDLMMKLCLDLFDNHFALDESEEENWQKYQRGEITYEEYLAKCYHAFNQITVDLGEPVIASNGVIDGTKVTFYPKDQGGEQTFYAYGESGRAFFENDTTAPVVTGIKNGGVYKDELPYISWSDDTAVARATLNGKDVVRFINNWEVYTWVARGSSTDEVAMYSDVYFMLLTPEEVGVNEYQIFENEKNTLVVYDVNGNSTTINFTIDLNEPVVKNISKNKTYKKKRTVYVTDTGGIKKVTDNGKKVKLKKVTKGKYKGYYKFTVKKKGKHKLVIRDVVGRKKIITIRIKK